MSDVAAAITALSSTTICGGITNIKRAYDVVPSGADLPLPCVIFMPFEGTISGPETEYEFAGSRMTVHRIKAQVLCSLQSDLQDSERQARPFLSRFVTTIDRWKTLNSTVNIMDATVASYRYGLINLRQGDQGYVGWEFVVRVLEVESGTNIAGSTGPTV